MLVLTRKTDQKIIVGDVTFTIVRVGANSVRVGIDAPASVAIVREELLATRHAPPATRLPCPALPAA